MIEISVINGNFYVWTAQGVCCAREEHRIVGSLVGCLPRLPRQNIHLGLPLQLSPCEARLLVDKGFAQLYNDSTHRVRPTTDEIEAFKVSRERLYLEQLELCKEARQQMMMKNFEKIVQGKRQKLIMATTETQNTDDKQQITKKKQKKLMRKMKQHDTVCGDHSVDADIEQRVRQQIENEVAPMTLPEKAVCVQIHTASDQQHQTGDCSRINKWNFDSSPRDTLLYRVFSHFWENGYFLTNGGKFGGDFLVYRGDPSRFHSFYVVVCIDHRRQLGAHEIVALGRLGTGVKKTTVLCSVDDSGQVCCMSLKWTGIG